MNYNLPNINIPAISKEQAKPNSSQHKHNTTPLPLPPTPSYSASTLPSSLSTSSTIKFPLGHKCSPTVPPSSPYINTFLGNGFTSLNAYVCVYPCNSLSSCSTSTSSSSTPRHSTQAYTPSIPVSRSNLLLTFSPSGKRIETRAALTSGAGSAGRRPRRTCLTLQACFWLRTRSA